MSTFLPLPDANIVDGQVAWGFLSRALRSLAAQSARSKKRLSRGSASMRETASDKGWWIVQLTESAEQAAYRTTVRTWLEEHRVTLPEDATRAERHREWSCLLHQHGYAGVAWPKAVGGQGQGPAFAAILAEEIVRCGAPPHINTIGLSMVGPTLLRYGSEEQRAKYLPRILNAEAVFCQAFSEPEAGSDLASLRCVATVDQDAYRLTGTKTWSSYAHLADYAFTLARTESGTVGREGLTAMIVPLDHPGVSVTPLRELSGDHDLNLIQFDDVVIPQDAVVGRRGEGWKVAMATLSHERGTFAVELSARLEVLLDRLRGLLGDLDAPTPMWREMDALVRRATALKYTCYRVVSSLDESRQPGPETSMLKLVWSETYQATADLGWRAAAFDPVAERGLIDEWQTELLRSRTATVEGGTSEVLRSVLAERALSMPKGR